jgi:hypothetical protein
VKHELDEIQVAAKRYADKREALTNLVYLVNDELERVYRTNLKFIRNAVANVADAEGQLSLMISARPDLFKKPRTLIFHGVKVGYRKGKGNIGWDDDAQVVKLIKKHFPEMTDALIHVEETPIKGALSAMEASDLKRLGITVEDTGDHVLVKAVDSAVDKTVKALLKNATDAAKEEA